MRGFLFGVLITAVVGGFFYHLGHGYGTASACAALETALVRDATRALRDEVQQRLGQGVPPELGPLVLQPLTEPLIRQRVATVLAERSWFGCAYDLIRLDVLDDPGPLEAVRSVTVRL